MADEEEKDKMIQCTKELKFYKAHGEGQGFDGTVFHGVFVLLFFWKEAFVQVLLCKLVLEFVVYIVHLLQFEIQVQLINRRQLSMIYTLIGHKMIKTQVVFTTKLWTFHVVHYVRL